ncbi:conserved hypothetical protein [Streptomyces sviceus ATCC 29083]|uniref:Uncharacterized protein n=1 Tax=Streptomyces sviceus (strain ATCC 29083 / DSM 924 / JCM 4929 / NBRC 13980 / NCIMB 11184 / NRRL 5439 / UC 5370) TaxID=463191 RepID=B5I140_STRX2|nr:conserved hypothetical protein [Streptomyces sviceus ATCC 29083]
MWVPSDERAVLARGQEAGREGVAQRVTLQPRPDEDEFLRVRRLEGESGAEDGGGDQMVEAVLAGQPVHLLEEVVAQGAADAAVGHLDFAVGELLSPRGAAGRARMP